MRKMISIKKIKKRFFKRNKKLNDSETYIKFLRKKGCKIGERTIVFDPKSTLIDLTRPWLIDIGNDVQITRGVTILTHGYDWSVLKKVYGDVLGSAGSVIIGNNVFIGMNSTILKGTTIGNNVIIGAGSVVSNNIPSNVVAAGNPCRVIMTLDEYYNKRKNAQLEEAKELTIKYIERYKKIPGEEELSEFFWLFSDGDDVNAGLSNHYISKLKLVGNYKESIKKLKYNKKEYKNLAEFINSLTK